MEKNQASCEKRHRTAIQKPYRSFDLWSPNSKPPQLQHLRWHLLILLIFFLLSRILKL